MTRVLLIEDDDEKAANLSGFLDEQFWIDAIDIAKSLQSGLRAALGSKADLILLDMTMTNFDRTLADDGGRPHAFAGREILRQMQREGVSVPVVVVTQFDRFGEDAESMTLDDLTTELSSRFPSYIGTVYYRSNVDDWKARLVELAAPHLVMRQ